MPPLEEARALFAVWLGCPPEREFQRVLWADYQEDHRELDEDEFPPLTPVTPAGMAVREDEEIPF